MQVLEIPAGLIEARERWAPRRCKLYVKSFLPEALPGLVNARKSITLITLVGYSAMGGAVGAGGPVKRLSACRLY